MCGFAGWVDFRQDLCRHADIVERMTATMACRGPDATGTWLSPRVGLGHRRLAVIDVPGGRQPMAGSSPERRAERANGRGVDERPAVLVYTGEVYNFSELREELRAKGVEFTTRSDTEVVLRSYLFWGSGCVEHFNGMFAFAVWDEARQYLLLARDRLGVKPLYFHHYPGGLLFGSEPKALLANPRFEPVVDQQGVTELFTLFGIRTPGTTPLRGLREVRPGELVEFDRSGLRERRYWSLSAAPHPHTVEGTVRHVRELLDDTVRGQLVSDVGRCVLVSGGVDSSALAALASRATGDTDTLLTYSVDFQGGTHHPESDPARPERDAPHVRTLVEHLGSRHATIEVPTPDLAEVQERATRARDLPSLGDLDAGLLALFEAMRGRCTVALSGEAADEVFGGYKWFHDSATLREHRFPWQAGTGGLGMLLSPALRRAVPPEEYLAEAHRAAAAQTPRLDGERGEERLMREVSYLALTRHLPMLLDRKDRMSMAAGIEVRVPFCDHRLVEYLFNVPWAIKCLKSSPKGLLRSAVADLLPASLAWRPKSVFPVPTDPGHRDTLRGRVHRLMRDDGPVAALVDPVRVTPLLDGSSQQPPWLQRLALSYLVQVDSWLVNYGVAVNARQ